MENKKGLSLIVLVITIIVMIILAGTVIVSLQNNNVINNAKDAVNKTDIATYKQELSTSVLNALRRNPNIKKSEINESVWEEIKKYIPSMKLAHKGQFQIVKGELVRIGEVPLPPKPEPEVKPDPDNGGDKPKPEPEKPTPQPGGGSIITGNNNKPTIENSSNNPYKVIPVKYKNDKWVICSENDSDWADYKNKKWGNVMLSDSNLSSYKIGYKIPDNEIGSMFVWIPRFAYSIKKYKMNDSASKEGEEGNLIDIVFLNGNTNFDKDGNKYKKDYINTEVKKGEPTPFIVHPAFTFGTKELKGIFVAKFQASVRNDMENLDSANGKIKVTPNTAKWKKLRIGNAFALTYKVFDLENTNKETYESHLMKNTEWGAVAYLAASSCGIIPTKSINSNLAGGGKYKENLTQTTTGNITGVYDMNSKVGEFVAGFINTHNAKIPGNGNTGYSPNENHISFGNTGLIRNQKYWNEYITNSKEHTKNEMWETNNNEKANFVTTTYNNIFNHKGDAIHEIANTFSFKGRNVDNVDIWIKKQSNPNFNYNNINKKSKGKSYYNDDDILIGNSMYVFPIRGAGEGVDDNGTGIFSIRFETGVAAANISFRPVLTEK